MGTAAIYNESDTDLTYGRKTGYRLELDVAFATMMEANIAARCGAGSPEHRAAVHALTVAQQEAA